MVWYYLPGTTTTTTLLWPFVRDHLVEMAPEETFHPVTYPDHHPTFVSFFHLLQSIASHHPCSIYVLDNLFAQPLSKSSLVYLLVWSPPQQKEDPVWDQCVLFATHAHTITACFAVVPINPKKKQTSWMRDKWSCNICNK